MRAVIAEDLALLRDGLIRLPGASGMVVVDAVSDGSAALRVLLEHRPDISILDADVHQ